MEVTIAFAQHKGKSPHRVFQEYDKPFSHWIKDRVEMT
jgi:hypothetical protein